jgi:formylglycine-generating enzyme required for sulfatase activity
MPTPLVFEFTRTGTSPATCTATTSPVTFDSTGAFSIEVPITCPTAGGRAFFNGDPVTYAVRLASDAGSPGELLTDGGVAITPVPYARFADQAGVNNDCPAGYAKSTDPGDAAFTVCRRTLSGTRFDEVVKVGTGASAFWIDRYEASVWDNEFTTGSQLFNNRNSSSTAFPPNGQWRSRGRTVTIGAAPTPPAYAFSISNVMPAGNITWFQAVEACAASGKALPTGGEWLRSAQGTDDSGDIAWSDGSCRNNPGSLGDVPRNAGLGVLCRSGWGAQDMIGNLFEWTDEWYAGSGNSLSIPATDGGFPGTSAGFVNVNVQNWSSGYNEDTTTNVATYNQNGEREVVGVPSAAARGGYWSSHTGAGIFSLYLSYAPSSFSRGWGFRCVIRR